MPRYRVEFEYWNVNATYPTTEYEDLEATDEDAAIRSVEYIWGDTMPGIMGEILEVTEL